ncbi:MAG: DUF1566 domain-containing protein [Alcanivoracaceae bacterium]|nr:DUF1566 domain-containing protein [Alcanivoracaceae bacterium]
MSIIIFIPQLLLAQSDITFINGFEKQVIFNDTGVTWAGHSSQANNTICESDMSLPQDCDHGRDSSGMTNINEDGAAGFSFTKLDTFGNPLSNNAELWSCVKDNITGLTWEIKTTSEGVHNKDNKYQWGGITSIGINHPDRIGDYFEPSWNKLINISNNSVFCGKNNWRAPTIDELSGLGNYSTFLPAIDTNFFPYTLNEVRSTFWSASPTALFDNSAWVVYFREARIKIVARDSLQRIRLVSDKQ